MNILEVRSLTKIYAGATVLDNVSFDVVPSEVVALIGPSGAGKSTLLRCIAGLEKPDGGTILIEDPEEKRYGNFRKTGMVFQNFNLFPQKTVLENIAMAPVLTGKTNRKTAVANAQRLLIKIGLANKSNRYPAELSGGQQQRVAIARALAMQPEIMLFDEPTSALDPELTGEVLKVIKNLADEKMTIIIASHEMGFVRTVADTVLFMEKGKVIESGPPGMIMEDTQPRIAAFFRRITSFQN